jgi:hypothetical protein
MILLVVIVMNQQGLWFMPTRYITEITTKYAGLSRQFHLDNIPRLIGNYLNFVPRLLINFPDNESPNLPMPYVWVGILALLMCTIAAFIRDIRFEIALLIPGLLVLVALSLRVVLELSPYRALHGILLSTPAIVMAVYVWPHAWRNRHPQLLLMLFSALFFSLLGIGKIFLLRGGVQNSFSPGLEWGARYLLVLYPNLMILSFIALKIYWQSSRPLLIRQFVIGILVFMLLWGFQFQIRGMCMLYSTKRTLVEWNTHLLSRSSQSVATDVWWLPASLATFFYHQ